MLLDMVNDATLRPDTAIVLKHVQDQPRALALVLQVRRVLGQREQRAGGDPRGVVEREPAQGGGGGSGCGGRFCSCEFSCCECY